ncbi:type II secretion system protein [Thalassoglobus sp.]|uniref:type II secretion system protein n=1 Tax=Thalassoglobus sp. TaxID=2795869 RepID=UPI003AA7EB0F
MQRQTKKYRNCQSMTRPTAPQRTRRAFSLVEIMIVLVIIGILLGLLFPAISKAITTARNATVTSEISNLAKAIGEFKLKYGVEPPSRIYLHEDSSNWSNTDLRTRESKAFIRQVWPNFDFTYANAPTAGELDINGNGMTDSDPIDLRGAECLVFFLGGVCATEDATGASIRGATGVLGSGSAPVTKWFPLGFSTDPEMPFARGSGTRVGPFFEFDASRLVDVSDSPPANILRNMPEYLDTLPGQTSPYLYASSYEGRGYNVNGSFAHTDLNLASSSITEPTWVYLQSDPSTEGTAAAIPYNKNSFQIISPGADTQYGTGGSYDKDEGFTGFADGVQKDNITNFSGGVLDAS